MSRRSISLTLAVLAVAGAAWAVSCGGENESGQAGTATNSDANASLDATPPPLAAAPFACGDETCRVDQYCVHPCCGGLPPECEPNTAGEACPAGSHAASCGCEKDPCVPAPTRCEDAPSSGIGGNVCAPAKVGGEPRKIFCVCG